MTNRSTTIAGRRWPGYAGTIMMLAATPGLAYSQDCPIFPDLSAPTYDVGSTPAAVAIGDLDGDGDDDLAVANSYRFASDISVLLNEGDGTFATESRHLAGTSPVAVAIGDLWANGDDAHDLVVANAASDTVSVLLNPGDATFPFDITYPVQDPEAVAIGDLNDDQLPDVAVAGYSGAYVMINVGQGAFAAPIFYDAGFNPSSIAIGNLDEDGKPDLALCGGGGRRRDNGRSGAIGVLLNAGDGTFPVSTSHDVGDVPLSIVIGDLNDDGRADLAVVNQDDDDVSVLIGAGSGQFLDQTRHAVGETPYALAIGDIDDDGHPDLLVANSADDEIGVLLNTGTGEGDFADEIRYGVGRAPQAMAIADLDGDSAPDVAVVNSADNNVAVLRNDGAPFAADPRYAAGITPRSVAVADFDGDGDADLAVVSRARPEVIMLRNEGAGTLRAGGTSQIDANLWSIAAGDLDGDLDEDIVVTNVGGGDVTVFLNTGTGDGAFVIDGTYGVGISPESVAIGDLDGDGDPDLAVANRSSNSVSVLKNDGDGTFAPALPYDAGSRPHSVVIADLDGDNDNDLVVGSDSGVGFLWNVFGNGTFPDPEFCPGCEDAVWIAVGDLDGDGDADLAAANESRNTVTVLLNNGDGQFAADEPHPVGSYAASVAIGDINGDGHADLAVANQNGNSVSVLLNSGEADGAFDAERQYAAGSEPKAVAIGDLDGDGAEDDLAIVAGSIVVRLASCGMCPTDLDGDGQVGYFEILAILRTWGNAGGPEDFDGDGQVGYGDVLVVLVEWGPCE